MSVNVEGLNKTLKIDLDCLSYVCVTDELPRCVVNFRSDRAMRWRPRIPHVKSCSRIEVSCEAAYRYDRVAFLLR